MQRTASDKTQADLRGSLFVWRLFLRCGREKVSKRKEPDRKK